MSETKTPNLLPCPFCGKDAIMTSDNLIICSDTVDCGAQIESGNSGDRTGEFTIRAWNRRNGEVSEMNDRPANLMNLLTHFLFLLHNPKMDNSHWFNAEKKLKEAIKVLASESENKQKGKWIYVGGYDPMVLACSVCKGCEGFASNFCPKCGEEMEV